MKTQNTTKMSRTDRQLDRWARSLSPEEMAEALFRILLVKDPAQAQKILRDTQPAPTARRRAARQAQEVL